MKKQYIAIAVAALLGVLGIAALVAYANNADDRAFEGTKLVPVLRATEAVPAGTPVAELPDSLETAKVPRAALVPGAITRLDELAGQVTTVALVPGDQLSAAKFGSPNSVEGDLTLPKGMQELTIPVGGARLVGGAVQAGDRVGVMSSYDGVTGNPINNLLVLKVETGMAAADSSADAFVTVAVKTLDAERLVHTLEFGKIWLTKQNDDTDTSGGKAITSKDVVS